jgi:hypothetical protein
MIFLKSKKIEINNYEQIMLLKKRNTVFTRRKRKTTLKKATKKILKKSQKTKKTIFLEFNKNVIFVCQNQ